MICLIFSDLYMVYANMLTDPNVWLCTLLAVFIGRRTATANINREEIW